MLAVAASRVKMSGSEKKKANGNKAKKSFVSTYNIFSLKHVTRKFHVTRTTAKKCTKKSVLHLQFVFVFA